MEEVKTLNDAMSWFLSHSSGSVTCVKDSGEKKVCECYPEAEEFYKE